MGFLKIPVSASDENLRIQNLCIMRAAFFEFYFPFQIDISCQQEILVDIVVESFDRDPRVLTEIPNSGWFVRIM